MIFLSLKPLTMSLPCPKTFCGSPVPQGQNTNYSSLGFMIFHNLACIYFCSVQSPTSSPGSFIFQPNWRISCSPRDRLSLASLLLQNLASHPWTTVLCLHLHFSEWLYPLKAWLRCHLLYLGFCGLCSVQHCLSPQIFLEHKVLSPLCSHPPTLYYMYLYAGCMPSVECSMSLEGRDCLIFLFVSLASTTMSGIK